MADTIVVTGGAGFIGSNFILEWLKTESAPVVNFDKLTYAGNLCNLDTIQGSSRYQFVLGDICDGEAVRNILSVYSPRAIVHFAAESHVDRSILGPRDFVRTNVEGTFCLLEECLRHWKNLQGGEKDQFRFVHVSTDEVFGSLSDTEAAFKETTAYAPNSPYSASKAASDHFVRAYCHTYGFPGLTTHCSNNYGPYQFPEKLIPLTILNARSGKPLPVYGDGLNVRDWLFVDDHCEALRTVLAKGQPGETYNIGGLSERTNIDVVRDICGILDELCPESPYRPHSSLITFVQDRPGHDRRYAIDTRKIESRLGWRPRISFESGLRKTVEWYLRNLAWVEEVNTGAYRNWLDKNYEQREAAVR